MREELWAGVELKLLHAEFHFESMGRSLEPPEQTATNVALQVSGAILGTGWQRSFYAHLDALLAAARSIPEIIQCCFAEDRAPQMRSWFAGLPAAEQGRRGEFSKHFAVRYQAFRALPLSTARHIVEHRTGVAPVEVWISGLFGITYVGSPANLVPESEIRISDDPQLAFLGRHHALRPSWGAFKIQDQPLFETCRGYLNKASEVVGDARVIAQHVHGTEPLSVPVV
jgi:hypothetical protein